MQNFLQLLVFIPFLFFFAGLRIPRGRERLLAGNAIFGTTVHLVSVFIFVIIWLLNGHPTLNIKHLVLFKSVHLEIFISYFFDKVTAAYALLGAVTMLLISI